MEEKY